MPLRLVGHLNEYILSTEYLNIDDISDYYNGNYFLPTLGPWNIDMYSEPKHSQTPGCVVMESHNVYDQMPESNSKVHRSQSIFSTLKHNSNQKIPRSYIGMSGKSTGGGEFIARIRLSIDTNKLQPIVYTNNSNKNNNNSTTTTTNINNNNNNNNSNEQKLLMIEGPNQDNLLLNMNYNTEFIIFGFINESTLINRHLSNKKISFQLCIGKFI
jgi:hypothetical protein